MRMSSFVLYGNAIVFVGVMKIQKYNHGVPNKLVFRISMK